MVQVTDSHKILLPNEDSDSISWEFEKEIINKLLYAFDEFETDEIISQNSKNFFIKRYDELNNNVEGLVNNVFLT